MKLIYKHPNTVSGVATDGHAIATSCFDGFVRLFNEMGQVMMAEKRGSQLNAVALRGGVIASDDDTSTLETGVAITLAGQIIRQNNFDLGGANALDIDTTGQFAVSQHPITFEHRCHDRIAGESWLCGFQQYGHDKWPMGVRLLNEHDVVIVGLDGFIRTWGVASKAMTGEKMLAANGCNSVAVSPDGSRICVTHWGKLSGSDPIPGLIVLDSSLNVLYEAEESETVHECAFLPDNSIVYGTATGRLCQWDGQTPIYVPPVAAPPVSKPVKKHGKQ